MDRQGIGLTDSEEHTRQGNARECSPRDEILSSSGTAIDGSSADVYEMHSMEDIDNQGHSKDSNEREEWVYLEDSNIVTRFFKRLWNGPRVAKDMRPTFPDRWEFTRRIDSFPEAVFRKRFPRLSVRLCILVVYCCLWSAIIFAFMHYYFGSPPTYYRSNGEKVPIKTISCSSTLFWKGKNNKCGLGAAACKPFDNEEVYVRCPALCDRGGWTYSAINVGDRRVKHTGFEIGGGELHEGELLSYPYRADSFACGAAVHAGVVSPFVGGCARVSMEGAQSSFESKKGRYGTDPSVKFDSFFPSSFSFRQLIEGYSSRCYDPRIPVLIINIVLGLPIFYLYEGIYGYWIITIVGYWTLVLFLDPPIIVDPYSPETAFELLSVGFQRLLPLGFVLYVLWKCSVKRTLTDGSPLVKVLCWFPTFWLGVMNVVTFDRLPVDRLTISDLKEQAGAMTAVGSIITLIVVCAVIQAYSLWKSGRFRKYLVIYCLFISALATLGMLPGLSLRIHHYILGILLVPGCATRGASAYLFQGILIGLVLSGVSRWDFASIVETKVALLRGEAGGSWKPPIMNYNEEHPTQLSWQVENSTTQSFDVLDAYSLLINDIEQYVGQNTTIDLEKIIQEDGFLSEYVNSTVSSKGSVKLYLRVARASLKAPRKSHGDYTNAAVLEWPQGIYHGPLPGVS